MPEFIMNDEDGEFLSLPEITQGYLEAMFFTEHGGSLHDGSFDPENGSQLPDEASWRDIHPDTLQKLVKTTTAWQEANGVDLYIVTGCTVGGNAYDMRRAGNDLWYTSNGHGVGFWDREFISADGDNLESTGDRLSDAAKKFGEACVGWETVVEETGEGVVYVD